ncbi:MAG: GNAT family N-acetyltransferase [Kaiparowitsia implicata GSE-PSE-MK54-09C]|nr:GNAT family N-acetyltransferase [Kaiparowitsia implicata GSE-PSE-MK54-09C]
MRRRLGIAALIQELDAYLWALYPNELYHYMAIADLQPPQVTFIAAYGGPHPIGCGALVVQQSEAELYGEIKRIFVSPTHRRRRIGCQLMALLEWYCSKIRRVGRG